MEDINEFFSVIVLRDLLVLVVWVIEKFLVEEKRFGLLFWFYNYLYYVIFWIFIFFIWLKKIMRYDICYIFRFYRVCVRF